MYNEGQKVDLFGSEYLVTRTYQLTDEEMKEHNLCYRDRVTLVKISGVNGPETMDFANRKEA